MEPCVDDAPLKTAELFLVGVFLFLKKVLQKELGGKKDESNVKRWKQQRI